MSEPTLRRPLISESQRARLSEALAGLTPQQRAEVIEEAIADAYQELHDATRGSLYSTRDCLEPTVPNG